MGRPKNTAAQYCANLAVRLYANWKSINRQLEIKDWGHSDEMKDEACRLAIEYHRKRLSRSMTLRCALGRFRCPAFTRVFPKNRCERAASGISPGTKKFFAKRLSHKGYPL